MLICALPPFLADNFEVLRAVGVALHPDNQLRVLMHALVLQNIPPHSVVARNQGLPLCIHRHHPRYDNVSTRKRIAIRYTKSIRRKEQKQSAEDEVNSHSHTQN